MEISFIHGVTFCRFPLIENTFGFSDGYTVSDVVMYWRDEPVVGVEDAELPQFTIVGWETNERKIKLATGKDIAVCVNETRSCVKLIVYSIA